jgi:hypothetical protein
MCGKIRALSYPYKQLIAASVAGVEARVEAEVKKIAADYDMYWRN